MAAITPKHLFGWQKEEELHRDLEQSVGEVLEKTASRFDSLDFAGASCAVELKSRLPKDKYGRPQYREKFDTWLVPVCKTEGNEKHLVVFYYWAYDKTLWSLDYDPGLWATFERRIPEWKLTQEHFYVPAEAWTLVKSY